MYLYLLNGMAIIFLDVFTPTFAVTTPTGDQPPTPGNRTTAQPRMYRNSSFNLICGI